MKDASAVTYFRNGDEVQVVCDEVTRKGSKLGGLRGRCVDVWEKCEVDPTCCCAEQVEEAHAVTVEFQPFLLGEGYRYWFDEDELRKVRAGCDGAESSDHAGGADDAELLAAEVALAAYDRQHRGAAAAGKGQPGGGVGGGLAANAFADAVLGPDRNALRAAVQETARRSRRLMLGFCAPDAASGVEALKRWVTALDIPRGQLHGMDFEGRQIVVEGPVYIKVGPCAAQSRRDRGLSHNSVPPHIPPNSRLPLLPPISAESIATPLCLYPTEPNPTQPNRSTQTFVQYNTGTRTFADVRANGGVAWKPGDAFLSKYDGDYQGVGYVPCVNVRRQREQQGAEETTESDAPSPQYAYLPLDLF